MYSNDNLRKGVNTQACSTWILEYFYTSVASMVVTPLAGLIVEILFMLFSIYNAV